MAYSPGSITVPVRRTIFGEGQMPGRFPIQFEEVVEEFASLTTHRPPPEVRRL
jgi:hypothetical protein